MCGKILYIDYVIFLYVIEYRDELFEINAGLQNMSDGQDHMNIDCFIDFTNIKTQEEYQTSVTHWTKNVNQHLKSFFSEFSTIKITDASQEIMAKIKYDPLRVSIRKLNETDYEIAGFKDQVNNFAQIVAIEKELIQNEITNKDVTGLKVFIII